MCVRVRVRVLSAGGWCRSTEQGCEAAGGGLWEEEVAISGGRATDAKASQVLGVNGFVALQDLDGLVDREPLPLTAYGTNTAALVQYNG